MAEENLNASEMDLESKENNTPSEDMVPRSEIDNLLSALKKEREARKIYEKDARDKEQQLERFKDVNPAEYQKLQEEAAAAAAAQAAAMERTALLEEKYGSQAAEATKKAEFAQAELQEFRKKYALEKVFIGAGGRTDSADGVSFFDMLVIQLGNKFRLEPNGTVTVIDANGDPVLDSDSGKRIDPSEYLATYKSHPVYGTFFKGAKNPGLGLGYGGTDASGIPEEDFDELSNESKFLRAFG